MRLRCEQFGYNELSVFLRRKGQHENQDNFIRIEVGHTEVIGLIEVLDKLAICLSPNALQDVQQGGKFNGKTINYIRWTWC